MNKLLGLFLSLVIALAPINVARSTLVTLPGPIAYPNIATHFNASPALGTTGTMTAIGHYVSYSLVAREDMVISHVGFRTGSVTGTTPTITVSIETVDTSTGLPSGSNMGGSTPATTGTVTANTWNLQALGGAATITKGQIFSVKLALAAGTTPSVGISNVNQLATFQANTQIPYLVINTGTPTKTAFGNTTPILALGSNSTTFYQVTGVVPASTVTNSSFSNSVAGAKRGLRFTIPMNARAVGIRLATQNVTGGYNICLYDDAGAELSNSCTAYVGAVALGAASGPNWTYFDNTVTLTAGTTYRAAIEPTTATNVQLSTITLPSASYRGGTLLGTTGHYTTFTTAGGWVDSATDQVPLIDVLIDQIDNGAGGGGGGRIIGG